MADTLKLNWSQNYDIRLGCMIDGCKDQPKVKLSLDIVSGNSPRLAPMVPSKPRTSTLVIVCAKHEAETATYLKETLNFSKIDRFEIRSGGERPRY